MKQKTKYRVLKLTDAICTGDAVYLDGVFGGCFGSPNYMRNVCRVLNRISGCKIEVRRKHKQRNKTKAKWL